MPIDSLSLIVLVVGVALGLLVGWLAARPAQARLRSELEKDRAVHAERLKAYQDAESTLKQSFQVLSHQALQSNNRAFLDLAETRLQQTHAEAAGDIEARKKAIEDLLSPMAKTLEHVDKEIQESERRRVAGRGAAASARRLARHRRQGAARRDAATGRCAQAPWRPRPLGRTAAAARGRARRHGGALSLHRAADHRRRRGPPAAGRHRQPARREARRHRREGAARRLPAGARCAGRGLAKKAARPIMRARSART